MTNQNNNTIDIVESDNDALNSVESSNRPSIVKFLFIVLVALLLLVGVLYGGYRFIASHFNGGESAQHKHQRKWTAPPDTIGRYTPPSLPPVPTEPPAEEKPAEEPAEVTLVPPPINTQEAPPPVGNEPETETLRERRLGSGVRSYTEPALPDVEKTRPSRQVKLMREIDYTLIKGTKIPCTLETNIVSEQQGFASCIISQDVYSGNARILLIEKGTKVTGEYQGDVKNGDRRLQIIWDRLITPHDIVIQLDSPSTEQLGASGVTGKVDNRWGTRIGSALLVSLMADALQVLGDNSQNADVIVDSKTADTGEGLAKEILNKNINLSPIIYIREGEMINIYVADDIDLSTVYRTETYGY